MTAHLIGVVGVPGEGKSHLLRSASVLGKTAVALTDPKERGFYTVAKGVDCNPANLAVEEFYDLDWRPHLGDSGRQASGYVRLVKWLDAQGKSDVPFVVLDTGTEASRLAQHEHLKMQGVFNAGDLEYGRGYTGTDTLTQALLTELRRLHARGKTVLVSFHARMKEMEGAGDAQKKKVMTGDLEWTFDQQLLAAAEGTNAFVQNIGSAFDLWLYTKPSGFGPGRKFFVTAQSDQVRPAKHSVTFKEGVQVARLPNTVKAILEAIV